MTNYSTKEAQQRFSQVIEKAQRQPVIIERHGRARAAIVSMRRFEIYENLMKVFADELAAENLHEAIKAAKEGRLTASAQLRKEAAFMARFGSAGADAGRASLRGFDRQRAGAVDAVQLAARGAALPKPE
ncbi:MAG: type II toxin-antitoxin system Phd/YefM family antitoxin [Parvularculaceae bacterium]|nr:type II toxin-antitoxin system Phd/YefM family antitoxin [Parvularculaceae bacterium]